MAAAHSTFGTVLLATVNIPTKNYLELPNSSSLVMMSDREYDSTRRAAWSSAEVLRSGLDTVWVAVVLGSSVDGAKSTAPSS